MYIAGFEDIMEELGRLNKEGAINITVEGGILKTEPVALKNFTFIVDRNELDIILMSSVSCRYLEIDLISHVVKLYNSDVLEYKFPLYKGIYYWLYLQ